MTDTTYNGFALSSDDIDTLAFFANEITEAGSQNAYSLKLELDRCLGLTLIAARALLSNDLTFNILVAPGGRLNDFRDALFSLNSHSLTCASQEFFPSWQTEYTEQIKVLHGLSVWLDINSKRLSSQQFFQELMRTAEEVSRVAKAQPQIRMLGQLTVSLVDQSDLREM